MVIKVTTMCCYEPIAHTKLSWKPCYLALMLLIVLFTTAQPFSMSFGLCVFSRSWQSREVITCVLRSLSRILNLVSLESILEDEWRPFHNLYAASFCLLQPKPAIAWPGVNAMLIHRLPILTATISPRDLTSGEHRWQAVLGDVELGQGICISGNLQQILCFCSSFSICVLCTSLRACVTPGAGLFTSAEGSRCLWYKNQYWQ